MASGNSLLIFTALAGEPLTSNSATIGVRNFHIFLAFDASTNESIVFTSIVPRHYGAGGLTVYLHYSMTSATSGDIDWDVAFERVGDQQLDIDSDSFAAAKSVNNTTVTSTNGLVDIVNITFTNGSQIDSIAVGESFRMKVTRDAASDTATGDAELHVIEIKET